LLAVAADWEGGKVDWESELSALMKSALLTSCRGGAGSGRFAMRLEVMRGNGAKDGVN
jgi:hypothetical protein